MSVEQKTVRRCLSRKISQLNDIVADLDGLVTEMGSDFYRVSIFGSARVEPDSSDYKLVYQLAYELARRGSDIVTGGGPGLMEAANRGAKEGSGDSRSYGLAIELPFEADDNSHLDVMYRHRRFSSRLDEFMRISHAVVITPGGIGTLLELFYTWQLLQAGHISDRPVILLGDQWEGLLAWIQEGPLSRGLLDEADLARLSTASTAEQVISRLAPHIAGFYRARSADSGHPSAPSE